MPPLPPALQWLYSVQQFGIKPGLDNTRRLLRELQVPGPQQRFLHVAGTNGKGSTCSFIESILRGAGERTGLFTSPHLVRFSERIRCGTEQIPPGEAVHGIEALRAVAGGWDPHPTFFELTLALALDWMDRRGAEVIVLETGMGGRLDATNAVTPLVSVLTPIAMDHEQWLGSTLADIAAEKAGIIKPGIPVVSAPQQPEAAAVIREAAARAGAPLHWVAEPWPDPVALPGEHQRWNAALAVAAVTAAGFRVPPSTVARGLASATWPARFQKTGRMVVDGAHNPHSTAALVDTWQREYPGEKAVILFGAVAAKDFAASLELLTPIAAQFLFVTIHSPRAVPAGELAAAAPPGIPATVAGSPGEALARAAAAPERTLVCGSLYLCGEVLALQEHSRFEPSAQ